MHVSTRRARPSRHLDGERAAHASHRTPSPGAGGVIGVARRYRVGFGRRLVNRLVGFGVRRGWGRRQWLLITQGRRTGRVRVDIVAPAENRATSDDDPHVGAMAALHLIFAGAPDG